MKDQQFYIMIVSAILAITAGLMLGQYTSGDSDSDLKPVKIQGAILPKAKIIDDFNLINQDSKAITKDEFKGHWSLLFIGYTHCPDVCPTTLAVMNQVYEFMEKQDIQPPEIVFLSIDPERDTADVLKPYVDYFNTHFLALTGSLDEIQKLTGQLNVMFRKAAGASGDVTADDYLMDHSSALILFNPEGNMQSILTAPHTPANIIDSIINSQTYYEQSKK
jgi:protein SCO1/2